MAKWIKEYDEEIDKTFMVCSECGKDAIDLESEPDVYEHNYLLTPFCPWCGAKMKNNKEE